jgi:hypothetical protein
MKYARKLYYGVDTSDYVPQEAQRSRHNCEIKKKIILLVIQKISSSENISGFGIGTRVSLMQYVELFRFGGSSVKLNLGF